MSSQWYDRGRYSQDWFKAVFLGETKYYRKTTHLYNALMKKVRPLTSKGSLSAALFHVIRRALLLSPEAHKHAYIPTADTCEHSPHYIALFRNKHSKIEKAGMFL